MPPARALGPIATTLLLALSGCTFPGGSSAKDFQPIGAPSWKSGYTWSYQITNSEKYSGLKDGQAAGNEQTHSDAAVITVFNTTKPLLNEDVYYVRVDGGLNLPDLPAGVDAISKADLSVAGRGSNYAVRSVPVPQPVMLQDDMAQTSSEPYHDPCDGQAPITPSPAADRFPMLAFPLSRGHAWTGRLANGGATDFGELQFYGKVLGREDVKTPIGTFSAIHVALDFSVPPGVEYANAAFPGDFHLRFEYWYAPDVEFIAKSVGTLTLSANDPQGGGSFSGSYTTTSVLTDYHLQAAPEEAAPDVLRSDLAERPSDYVARQIVSDTSFPVNMAEGSTNATFGLAEYGGGGPFYYGGNTVRQVDAVPASAGIDPTTHEVHWTLTSDDFGAGPVESVGDTFAYDFTGAAHYWLQAEIRPVVCGASNLGHYYSEAPTYWEKSFHVAPGIGAPQVLDVAGLPIGLGATSAVANWTQRPAFGTPIDKGYPQFVRPSGGTQGGSSTSRRVTFQPYPAGDWSIQWNTESVTVGDTFDLTVRVNYGDNGYPMH